MQSLLPKNLHPLLNRLLRLLARTPLGAPKHQLRNQSPVTRDTPLLCDGAIDDRVVVLEVRAEAEGG